ncbi:MAG TPA: hypothetical protein VME46_15300 [Acidimicrobiales bacterium]|nr:hypothetical protein [Acidimicrobiales bacterium]
MIALAAAPVARSAALASRGLSVVVLVADRAATVVLADRATVLVVPVVMGRARGTVLVRWVVVAARATLVVEVRTRPAVVVVLATAEGVGTDAVVTVEAVGNVVGVVGCPVVGATGVVGTGAAVGCVLVAGALVVLVAAPVVVVGCVLVDGVALATSVVAAGGVDVVAAGAEVAVVLTLVASELDVIVLVAFGELLAMSLADDVMTAGALGPRTGTATMAPKAIAGAMTSAGRRAASRRATRALRGRVRAREGSFL